MGGIGSDSLGPWRAVLVINKLITIRFGVHIAAVLAPVELFHLSNLLFECGHCGGTGSDSLGPCGAVLVINELITVRFVVHIAAVLALVKLFHLSNLVFECGQCGGTGSDSLGPWGAILVITELITVRFFVHIVAILALVEL